MLAKQALLRVKKKLKVSKSMLLAYLDFNPNKVLDSQRDSK